MLWSSYEKEQRPPQYTYTHLRAVYFNILESERKLSIESFSLYQFVYIKP